MPCPAWKDAVQQIPGARHDGADGDRGIRAQRCAGQRIDRLAGARRTGRLGRAARHVEHRGLGRRPPVRQEIRGLQKRVVLRLLMREPQAVVERQPIVHFPVVLHVPFDVVIEVVPLHITRLLGVGREDPQRRVRKPEARVERVVRVLAEIHTPGDRKRLAVLRLVAVIQVEPGFQRVASRQLRRADREVLRPVDVHPAGVQQVGRRVRDAAAPVEARRQHDASIGVHRRVVLPERVVGVVPRIDDFFIVKPR